MSRNTLGSRNCPSRTRLEGSIDTHVRADSSDGPFRLLLQQTMATTDIAVRESSKKRLRGAADWRGPRVRWGPGLGWMVGGKSEAGIPGLAVFAAGPIMAAWQAWAPEQTLGGSLAALSRPAVGIGIEAKRSRGGGADVKTRDPF